MLTVLLAVPSLSPRKGSSTSHEYQKQVVPLLSASTADLPIKSTLNRIVDELERLAISLDAHELAISKGSRQNGDIVANSAIPESIVSQRLSDLRLAVDSLSTEGAAEPPTTSSS
jgi:hypothetical protein